MSVRSARPRARARVARVSPIAALVVAALAAVLLLVRFGGQRTLYEAESDFGRIVVKENRSGVRSLYTGAARARQTALDPERPLHLELAYTRVATIGLALVAPDARILYVGLGGGAMPTHAHHARPAATIDVVEIDPVIVDVAREWFAFTPDERLGIHIDDGRAFIERAPPASWDLIVLDAFSDNAIPYALTTRQFLAAVRAALADDGVVASNLFTAAPEFADMVATYRAVFDNVSLIRVPQHRQAILLAAGAERPLERRTLVSAARAFAADVTLGFDLVGLVERGITTPPASGAVLEDRVSGAAGG